MNFDIFRLVRLALAGALAGLVIFCIFNPAFAQEERATHDLAYAMDMLENLGSVLIRNFLQMMVLNGAFSLMLGGMLVLADEYMSPPKRIAIRMGMVSIMSIAAGAAAGAIAQFMFMVINIITLGMGLILARGLGWAVMGIGTAICVGYVLGGWKRARMAVLGGFIGGLAGGLVFDAVGAFAQDGSLSRLIGFTLIGLATGAAVAIVEDIAKQNWVTVLNGPKEGRSFILTKPTTTIGRDELADIPLFGDQNVAKQHACLTMQDNMIVLQAVGGPVCVNGAQMPVAQLRPWDVITIGRFSLRFHQKATQASMAYVPQPLPDLTSARYRPQYTPTNQTISQPAVRPATGNLTLTAVSGPHLNQRFQFGPGTLRIGREIGCAIKLAQDPVISRNHAELTWTGTGWVIRDLQSRNGLWINGTRVTEKALSVGDQIGMGQSWLRVDSL